MDRHLWYYKFLADVDWLENFIADVERTDRALVLSLTGETGVASGFDVTQKGGGQNFSVDITAGSGYDPSGRRFYSASTQNLPFIEDELGDPIQVTVVGNARIVSIYAHYALVDKPGSEVLDGFGDQVFTIQEELVSFHLYQGAEALLGTETAAAYPGNDMTLLANVQIRQGDLTIANADIDNDVKQYLSLTLAPGIVGEDNIDWGLGVGQVSAADVPIEDVGGYFTGTDVEAALQEIGELAISVSVPIGSIIPFYDFNGAVTFDTAYWDYCRGQVIADAMSPLNGQTMPDLSGRYLVGFGTDGGANLHNGVWAATAVGNASHQVSIQHSHTVNSHNHTGPSHTHGPGTLQFEVCENDGDDIRFYRSNGVAQTVITLSGINVAAGAVLYGFMSNTGALDYYTRAGTGVTAAGGTGATGNTSPGTDNQLSTTQSIQPRSLRVRFIMRKR